MRYSSTTAPAKPTWPAPRCIPRRCALTQLPSLAWPRDLLHSLCPSSCRGVTFDPRCQGSRRDLVFLADLFWGKFFLFSLFFLFVCLFVFACFFSWLFASLIFSISRFTSDSFFFLSSPPPSFCLSMSIYQSVHPSLPSGLAFSMFLEGDAASGQRSWPLLPQSSASSSQCPASEFRKCIISLE